MKAVHANFMELKAVVMALAPVKAAAVKAQRATGGVIMDIIPKSDALSTRFGAQWLRLQDLEKIYPDALLFPYYDFKLGEALSQNGRFDEAAAIFILFKSCQSCYPVQSSPDPD